MFRRAAFGLLLLLSLVTVSAPVYNSAPTAHAAPAASQVESRAQFLDTIRVVGHLALAYGVFHHFVYKPWKAGNLSIHHPIKLGEAGLALLFSVHELRVALKITKNAKSGPLHALNGALSSLSNKFQSVGDQFHKNPSSLSQSQVDGDISSLGSGVDASNKILNAPDAPVSALPSAFR